MTTWRGPEAQAPVTSVDGLKRMSAWGSSEKPSLGALPALISFPSDPTSLTVSLVTEPSAKATSASACTFASTAWGKVGFGALFPFVFENAALPLMTASAFLYEV